MARPRKITASFTRVRRAERRLYYWLREHHEVFAAELERTRVRDRWSQALAVITEHKLLDGRGNPPTKETAADTWKRVCADIAAERSRKQAVAKAGPALQPGEIAPGVRAVGDNGWDRLTEPAGSPALSSRSLTPQAAAPAGSKHGGTAADRMQHLRDSMRAGKVPLPKPI